MKTPPLEKPVKKETQPVKKGASRKRDWREQVRNGDEAPSGTFRIPRF